MCTGFIIGILVVHSVQVTIRGAIRAQGEKETRAFLREQRRSLNGSLNGDAEACDVPLNLRKGTLALARNKHGPTCKRINDRRPKRAARAVRIRKAG